MRKLNFLLLLAMIVMLVGFAGCGDDDDDSSDDDDDSSDDDSSDDDDDTVPGDFAASMKVNPICDLSSIVTWTTDEPATSYVKFGLAGGDYTQIIGDEEMVTDHEVIVVGMKPDNSYKLIAQSEFEGGEIVNSQELAFDTGSLPYTWMETEVDVYKEDLVQEGWTMANMASGSLVTMLTVILLDFDGDPVWYYQDKGEFGRIDVETHLIDDKYVLVGPGIAKGQNVFMIDLAGNKIWEGPMQTGDGMNEQDCMHHVFHMTDDGNFVTTRNDIRNNIVGDEIQVFDEDENLIWSWNFWDHLTYEVPVGGAANIWTHVNAVDLDLTTQMAYISSYTTQSFFKVNMQTDEIEWQFTKGGDFSGDTNSDYPWHSGGHGIEYLGDGRLLVYDNGTIGRGFSRAVIFDLDETNMTSTIEWEFRGDNQLDQWYNQSVGDADYLPNGNVLITAGNSSQNQSRTRYIEVAPDGTKVWQCWLFKDDSYRVASFQSERVTRLAKDL